MIVSTHSQIDLVSNQEQELLISDLTSLYVLISLGDAKFEAIILDSRQKWIIQVNSLKISGSLAIRTAKLHKITSLKPHWIPKMVPRSPYGRVTLSTNIQI